MGRKGKFKPLLPLGDVTDPAGFQNALDAHLMALKVKNYSQATFDQRQKYLRWFIEWCLERDVRRPGDVSKAMLERYQRHLYHYRDAKDKPMGFVHQAHHLSHLRAWFRWLCKQNLILFNPASEIELPKLGHRLPKAILSAKEAEKVLAQPDVGDRFGLRDRAMLEVLYSCGIRRGELSGLTLYSMDAERGTLMIRQGKGKKDRLIPIGKRAIGWVQRYLSEARPKLVINPTETALFISNYGLAIEPDSLTEFVRKYIDAANIGKRGSCHLFRHTMATLMLDNGADIRYIQAMLGHVSISTTEIYTQVAIRRLQQIHSLTHPADLPPPKDTEAETDGSNSSDDRPNECLPESPIEPPIEPTQS